MQVYNNPQIPNTTTPNFKAIKSVKFDGLYKTFPKQAKEMVDTFKENKVAMDFCKKYDTDIVFYAVRKNIHAVNNAILMFFNNPAKKKFLGIFGSKRDKISLSTYSNEFELEKSFTNSVNRLKNFMINDKEKGLLISHINNKEKEINKVLSLKNDELIKKQTKKAAKQQAKLNFKNDSKNLDQSIQDLIENSK